jgi:pyrroloquinoline-quinone synthase
MEQATIGTSGGEDLLTALDPSGNPLPHALFHRLKPQLLWGRVAIKETLSEAVETVARCYDFSQHPYFQWATHPDRTREEFLRTQVPFRFAVENFSQALAGVLAHIPRVEDRIHVAENVAEEHGHGNVGASHKSTYLEYLNAMGATEADLAEPCPIWVTAFNHSIRNLCLAQTYDVGAACLGGIEHLYVGISGTISRLIHERGWVQPGTQRHYAVHEKLDVAHARELLDLAEPAWESPRTRSYAALGLLLGAYYFWTLYEDLLVGV